MRYLFSLGDYPSYSKYFNNSFDQKMINCLSSRPVPDTDRQGWLLFLLGSILLCIYYMQYLWEVGLIKSTTFLEWTTNFVLQIFHQKIPLCPNCRETATNS